MNVANGKFKTLGDFTLEETENIHKELEGHQKAKFEMKEAITSFECRFIESLGTIEYLKDKVMMLKEGTDAGGSTSPVHDREARF